MHYRELDVYQRSYKLALKVHTLSQRLPKILQFDLADQLRRSSRSVPANIAEGCGRRKSFKDEISYIRTALGSNDETSFHIEFCKDAGIIEDDEARELCAEYEIVGKQLNRLIQTLEERKTAN